MQTRCPLRTDVLAGRSLLCTNRAVYKPWDVWFYCLQSVTLSKRQYTIWKIILRYTCIVLVKTSERARKSFFISVWWNKVHPSGHLKAITKFPVLMINIDHKVIFSTKDQLTKRHLAMHAQHIPAFIKGSADYYSATCFYFLLLLPLLQEGCIKI